MENTLLLLPTLMDGLAEWALSNVIIYGVPILLLLTYIGSLGIPFPVTLVIVAAGALARQGILDWRLAVLACLLGSALADNSEYLLGRLGGRWIEKHFDRSAVWQKAHSTINRQGWWAIVFTRFWLTPLAPAVNLIAGSRYPYLRFLLFDVIGQFIWVLLYGGIGFIVGGQWELVSQTISNFTGVSIVLVGLAFVIGYLILRTKKAVQ